MDARHSTHYDAVVVGASQTGLAVGYYLRSLGLRFLVLDAGPEIGSVWRSRWDSLTLFTPAQYSGLPGMDFPAARDVYPAKDDVVAYLRSYAAAFDLPVRLDTRVTSLAREGEGYVLRAGDELVRARQVVVTTGPFQAPHVPRMARDLDGGVAQIHSAEYRNPAQLPVGRVLVVGGGNSGFQIAAELARTRRVDLAIGARKAALPQRLLGRDVFWWLTRLGVMRISVESRIGRWMAERDVLIGSTRRQIRRDGVAIRERLVGFEHGRAVFADGSSVHPTAVIWATGYRPDYSWIHVPGVVDATGGLLHRRGVTDAPGLFFVGLPWQHTRGSALIGFLKDDAAYVVGALAAAASAPARAPAGRPVSPAAPSHSGREAGSPTEEAA